MKPTIYRIHFNKKNQCWSVHNRGVCHLVPHINFVIANKDAMRTEEKPNNKSNPRFFIRVYGIQHKIDLFTKTMTIYA